ncbi:MAG TPA: hypothetical protein VF598_12920 [Hymenobacter sp.]|jgi:hypothetical protein
MELDVKLKFPTENAAAILAWLRSLPYGVAELRPHDAEAGAVIGAVPAEPMDLAERERRLLALFGAWKSEQSGEELNQLLQQARYTEQRDIDL